MIILDTISKSIQVVLTSAVATQECDVVAAWADNDGVIFTEGSSDTSTNGITPVLVVFPPAATKRRVVKTLAIHNRDSAPVTVLVNFINGSAIRRIAKVTLEPGDTWTFEKTFNQNGQIKQVLAGSPSGSGIVIFGGANSQSTGTVNFFNSNGITFGLATNGIMTASHNGLMVQSVQTQSNVQGISAGTQIVRTGDIVFANSNGVSFGLNGSVLTASVAAGGGTGGGVAISGGANSQGTGTVNFANSNGISFGLSNNGTMTASYTVPSTAGLLSGINLSAGTLSSNLAAVTFANSNGVSFGLNTNGVVTATALTNLSHSNLLGLDEDAHPRVTNALSTTLLVGGEITINADPTKFDIAAGVGIVIDNHTDAENPTRTIVSWPQQLGITDPFIASDTSSNIGIDISGNVVILASVFDEEQRRDIISIGSTTHVAGTVIESADTYPVWEVDTPNQLQDFLLNFGAFNIEGNEYHALTGMTIQRSAGKSFVAGGNYSVSPKSPNVCVTPLESPVADLYYYYQSSPGVWVNDTAATPTIDPDNYDSGSGLTAVTAGKWTIQTLFFYAPWGYCDIQYGQVEYDSLVDAQAALQAAIAINPWIGLWDTFRAWLIIQEGCTDITDPATSLFVSAGKLGLVSAASGGGSGGEVNTMDNHGNAGVGIFYQKLGVNFEMKNIASGSPRISVSNDVAGTNVRIDVVESAISHGNLSGLSAYDHPQYFATSNLSVVFNVSAGTTSASLGSVVFSNSNGISFGLNGGTVTASHNGITSQSVQTQSNVQGLSAGTQVGRTGDIVFSNSNGISFGMSGSTRITASYTVPSTAGLLSAINVSGGTTSQNLSALTFSNSNGVSFGLNGSVVTASVGAGGGGAAISGGANSQSTGTVNFANSNGITFGLSNNGTMTASHNGITSQSNQQMTAFAAGNTTQSSSGTFNASSVVFAGAGIASVGVTNGSVVVSVPAGAPSPVNFSAGTTSGNLGSVVFSNSNGVSFGLNGSTVTASVGAAGGGITLSGHQPYSRLMIVTNGNSQGGFHIAPMVVPSFQFDRVIMPINFLNTSNLSGSQTISVFFGIYTRNVSTLSLLASTSVSYGITNSGTVGNYSLVSAMRNLSVAWTSTFGASNYWIGVGSRTTSGGANASFSNFAISQQSTNFIAPLSAAGNNTHQLVLGLGYYTATTNSAPASVAFSHIAGTAAVNLRPILFQFASGTA